MQRGVHFSLVLQDVQWLFTCIKCVKTSDVTHSHTVTRAKMYRVLLHDIVLLPVHLYTCACKCHVHVLYTMYMGIYLKYACKLPQTYV